MLLDVPVTSKHSLQKQSHQATTRCVDCRLGYITHHTLHNRARQKSARCSTLLPVCTQAPNGKRQSGTHRRLHTYSHTHPPKSFPTQQEQSLCCGGEQLL